MAGEKIKVAVLGGGIGAMSAALALTEIDPTGETYEITVHQLGWRLGGKTASGRNPKYGQRIEEHGLHIWSGAYANAFTLMRIAFKALNRPPGPLATIGDAFKRQNDFSLSSDEAGGWSPWPFWFPPDEDANLFPGADNLWDADPVMPSIVTLIRRLIEWIEAAAKGHPSLALPIVPRSSPTAQPPAHLRAFVAGAAGHAQPASAAEALPAARRAAELLENGEASAANLNWPDVADLLRVALGLELVAYQLAKGQPGKSGEIQGIEAVIVGTLIAIGAIDNACIDQGFHTIDGLELRDFLLQASPLFLKPQIQALLAETVLLRAFYDYCFAYEAGDRAKPSLSACTAVQALLRLGLTYKGAFFFKATAGFGDTIFTPIYQVLKSRGVNFQFFHKVTDLLPSADGASIETIVVEQQAALMSDLNGYQPLVPVNGIECWPSAPRWSQLVNGRQYEADGVDFEAYYSPQPPPVGEPLRLQRGQHFDKIVLGISVGALGTICKALVAQRKDWADMVANLATVRTQALQFWVDSKVEDLGGPFVAPPNEPPPAETLGPITTGYVPPLDTYSDMSQLLPAEDWPAPGPLSVAYFCGAMADAAAPNDAKIATEAAKTEGLAWTTQQLQALWTKAGKGAAFNWTLLHVKDPATGEARYDQQYWRANISPSERYVLSLPNTLQHRLEPGKSGYANLFLAGDWPKAPEANVGAVEVAVMCGLSAASALSGVKIPIVCSNTLYGPLTPAQPSPQVELEGSIRNGGERTMSSTYLNYSGWVTLPRPPFNCLGAEFYAFGFPGNLSALQSYLDKTYNAIAGRKRFQPLIDLVFFACVKNTAIVATTPPFSEQGGTPEIDVGFWILAGSFKDGETWPQAWPTEIAWIPAYLFVDNGLAVSVGREIMGYPKYFANIAMAAGSPSHGPFVASALLTRTFAPSAIASQQQFLSLHGTNVVATGGNGPTAPSSADAFARLSTHGRPDLLQALAKGPHGSIFLPALNVPVPVWYLKQSRSADGSDVAIYQQILEGPLTLTTLRGVQFLSGRWTLDLGAFDSLPFISDLGLGATSGGKLTLTTDFGVWASCDYTSGTASAIV